MLAVTLCGLLSGCGGGGGGDRLPTAPVSGTVTLDGQSFGPGLIEFLPAGATDPTKSRMASGQVDASGNFVMGSYDATDGVVPGQYMVRLTSGSDDPNMPGPEVTIQQFTLTVPEDGQKNLAVTLTKGKASKGGTGLLSPQLDSGGASTDL
jgi:hypothetical protein